MRKKIRLTKILEALSPDSTREAFDRFTSEVEALKKNLKQEVNIATVSDVKNELRKFKEKIDLTPLQNAVSQIEEINNISISSLRDVILSRTEELQRLIESGVTGADSRISQLSSDISDIQSALQSKERVSSLEMNALRDQLLAIEGMFTVIPEVEQRLQKQIDLVVQDTTTEETLRSEIQVIVKEIEQWKRDILTRLGNIGGGNANRNIAIGGNSSVLSTYTDINLKAGSNVTITYTNNNTTKFTDITISASGSGGAGITREINSVAVDTNAGATADIDYVYLVSGVTTITLPTAVGNENLYTIKNVGGSLVTIATTGGQTIDLETSIQLPIQYTAVDLISDGSNWNVT